MWLGAYRGIDLPPIVKSHDVSVHFYLQLTQESEQVVYHLS